MNKCLFTDAQTFEFNIANMIKFEVVHKMITVTSFM